MDWERAETDAIEQQLIDDERLIARLRARQVRALQELDTRQVTLGDGSRSLSEWTAARLDVGPETAQSLVRTMRRLEGRPDLHADLASGETSFDRVEAISRIAESVGLLEWADVAGVRREAAKRARISVSDERRAADDRFLVLQPTLDESWWKLWGGLDGHSGAIVDKVLSEAANALPELPDQRSSDLSWRKATALVEALTSDEAPPTQVTVIVDAKETSASGAESGVTVEAGAGVGRQALEAILCDATTEVVARSEDGRFMEYGRRARTAPPGLRRALVAKNNSQCWADGCDVSRRLQVHHVTPWSEGGPTDQENLVVLCWFHHQVAVHERGLEIYRSEPGRIRFRRPPPG